MRRKTLLLASFLAAAALPGASLAQAVCSATPPAGVPACGGPTTEFMTCGLMVGGLPRHFCLHVPAFPVSDVPAVFAFHGGGGSGSVGRAWLDKHTEQGMILVAPSALPSRAECTPHWRHLTGQHIPDWNAFGDPDACATSFGPYPANSSNSVDLDFIDALLDGLDQQFDISNRYAVGFSNGAGMVFQLMITQQFAERFDGFAAMSVGIGEAKQTAAAGSGGYGAFDVNSDYKRPTIFIAGTGDKVMFPAGAFIDRVNDLHALVSASGSVGDPCYSVASPEEVFACMMSYSQRMGEEKHDFYDQIAATKDWLVEYNNAEWRARESLYPDLGTDIELPPERQDRTVTVRRDYEATADEEDSEHVAVLTVIEGGHAVPGVTGGHAPCQHGACDFNAIEVILQFWRAHAGLRNLWR